MITKKCIRCNKEKDINQFYKNKRKKDGYGDLCIDCAEKCFHISNIYIIESNGIYKIGESKNPEKRVKQLQTGNHLYLRLIKIYDNLEYAKIIERILHTKLDNYRLEGEWFKCDIQKIYKVIDNTLEILNGYESWKYYKHGNKYEKQYLKEQREFELEYQEMRKKIYDKALSESKNKDDNDYDKDPKCVHCGSNNVDVANTNHIKYIGNFDIKNRMSEFYCHECKRYFYLNWENLI